MDNGTSFFIGVFVGLLILYAVCRFVPSSVTNRYYNAINECEKELPRDQKCKIIGVIDNE